MQLAGSICMSQSLRPQQPTCMNNLEADCPWDQGQALHLPYMLQVWTFSVQSRWHRNSRQTSGFSPVQKPKPSARPSCTQVVVQMGFRLISRFFNLSLVDLCHHCGSCPFWQMASVASPCGLKHCTGKVGARSSSRPDGDIRSPEKSTSAACR